VAVTIRRSARGYHEAQEVVGCLAVPATVRRTVSRAVFLYIGADAGELTILPRCMRKSAASWAALGSGPQQPGDLVNRVEAARGDVDDEIVSAVVGERQPIAVDTVEGDERR
jgi:hypothetical protein